MNRFFSIFASKIDYRNYMKTIKITLICAFLCAFVSAFAKDGNKPVYAFGVADSFNDSIVYYTEIQVLDSASLQQGFLPQREAYSYQLKYFVEGVMHRPDRLCMIYFSTNKKSLQKQQQKLLARYLKKRNMSPFVINIERFVFTKPQS